MKNVKNLKIKTHEGFEVKNLQRFPSMEWGDDGGMSAELYYNGKLIATIFNQGDGGDANIDFTDHFNQHKDVLIEQAKVFLGRTSYAKHVGKFPNFYDEWEYVVLAIEEQYDKVKMVSKAFKKGYKSVAVVSNPWEMRTLSCMIPNLTEQMARSWMDEHKWNYPNIDIFHLNTDLTTM